MNLTLNIEEEISVLDKYGITPNELLVLKCILILQDEDDEELFHKLITTLKRIDLNLRDILISLQNKKIILSTYNVPKEGTEFDPFAIPINRNFIKNLYRCSFEMGKELFEVYPQFTTIEGSLVSLRSVSKKYDSLEQAYFKYSKQIGWNPEKHKYIIDLVQWAKDNNLINFTLASFIVDRRYLDLQAMRDGGTINYDSIKLI